MRRALVYLALFLLYVLPSEDVMPGAVAAIL